MTTRTLELNLRARADTKGLEALIKGTEALTASMRRTGAAFDEANADARKLAQAYGALSQEEREQVTNAARLATAVSQAAAARERAAQAAANTAAAESRALATAQQAEGAALRTAAAQERLVAAQSGAAASVSRAAAAEEKLAQERQRTFQATAKSEKAELDVARAREQLRASTARAEAAEQRLTQTRKSGGLAADIVKQQFQALVTGGAILMAGRQLLDFGRSSIAAASDAEEATAKFDQVFGALAEGTRDNLEIMAEANRRSIYDLASFASTLQDTFVPLGFAREEAASLSTTVTQLGIDIAAFSNKADSEVIQNLTSAIVGNHEAVRSYGIVLTETVLKQELARMGADNLTGAQLELAKAQARVNIIMRASADAQGAAVREADSYANTLKAFDAAVLELKVSIGEGLLPLMTELAETAIDIVQTLNSDYARGLLATEEANRKAGASARDLTNDLKQVIATVRESGNWWDKLKASQGYSGTDIGNSKEIAALLEQIAVGSESVEEFRGYLDELGLSVFYLIEDGGMLDLGESTEELAEQFYATARAAPVLEQALSDLAEMEAAYEAKRGKIAAADEAFQMDNIAPAWVTDTKTEQAMAAWGAWADDLTAVAEATKAATEARLAFNVAFGENFNAAPVDDLIAAQGELRDAMGGGDDAYTGDVEAAEEARAAIIAANQAIQDSYYERAYNSIAARLIEEGNFAAMADLAVSLGIMTQEEANLRMEYAQTVAAIDTLTASTAFYGLTAAQQAGAIKSLADGIYATADAALKAQENLKATQDFYSTAPDSTAISEYYNNLATQAAPDEGITTVVSVSIDPTAQREFTGFREELEDYDTAIYETKINANAEDALDDFERMGMQLDDLTRNAWVIKVRYETEGNAPGSPGGGYGGGGNSGGGGGGAEPTSIQSNRAGAYVDLTVNNYGSGDVSRAVREGVLAAYRSMG